MATLMLKMGISYHGIVHATEKEPFVEVDDPATVAYLTSDGRFELIPEPEARPDLDDDETPEENPEEPAEDDEEHIIPSPEELEDMTVAELKAWAEAHDIDITACKKKADYMEAISVWGGGSYTMMEIQKAPNYKEEE